MYRFLLKRIIGLIFVLFCITFITFIMGYYAPGDPVRLILGPHFNPILYAQLKHAYGLDLPWWQQYYNFLFNILHGTFGQSFEYPDSTAWQVMQYGVPTSVDLGLEVLITTLLLGIPTGIIAALRSNTRTDTAVTTIMLVLYAIPDIALIVGFQTLMVWLFQHNLPALPVAGWDNWQEHIGPVLITATTGAGYITRLTKTSVLEVMGQDFIRTARSKGLKEFVVIGRHVMRYASLPILTSIGPSLAYLVTGVFITEYFFNIPGIASVTITAITQRDYPVMQATVVLTAISVVAFNALTDVSYVIFDPRIRLE
jgi:ABC-type dipeptide/oligopeptide/nickel transport system permease component